METLKGWSNPDQNTILENYHWSELFVLDYRACYFELVKLRIERKNAEHFRAAQTLLLLFSEWYTFMYLQ
jgi:hypothetical protein